MMDKKMSDQCYENNIFVTNTCNTKNDNVITCCLMDYKRIKQKLTN